MAHLSVRRAASKPAKKQARRGGTAWGSAPCPGRAENGGPRGGGPHSPRPPPLTQGCSQGRGALTQQQGSPQQQQPPQPLHPAHPSPRCCPAPTGALNTPGGWAGSWPSGTAPSLPLARISPRGRWGFVLPSPAPPRAPRGALPTRGRVGADAVRSQGLGSGGAGWDPNACGHCGGGTPGLRGGFPWIRAPGVGAGGAPSTAACSTQQSTHTLHPHRGPSGCSLPSWMPPCPPCPHGVVQDSLHPRVLAGRAQDRN